MDGLLWTCFDRKWSNNQKVRMQRALHAILDVIYDYDYIFVEGIEEEDDEEKEEDQQNEASSPSKSKTMDFESE